MDLFATALPALGQAWALILQPVVLGYLVLGVVMGLAVGVFPGLGGIAGLSLLLPFMFGMDPVLGLALMIGMVAVVPTSDTFASVLMGIPGSSASQATVLDGFPMAKKGQAARALSAAFTSSLFGGLVGAAFLTLFIVVARPIVLSFGLPEMLMISILGLSMVAVPHVFGAPQASEGGGASPPELAAHFAASSLVTAAVFWCALGWLSATFWVRFNNQ